MLNSFARSIFAMLLLFSAVQPALANIKIEDITVTQDSEGQREPVSVTIELFNAGDRDSYPGKVRLEVREDSDQPWQSVRVWDLGASAFLMETGQRHWLDYQSLEEDLAIQKLFDGNYEVRAIVEDSDRPSPR